MSGQKTMGKVFGVPLAPKKASWPKSEKKRDCCATIESGRRIQKGDVASGWIIGCGVSCAEIDPVTGEITEVINTKVNTQIAPEFCNGREHDDDGKDEDESQRYMGALVADIVMLGGLNADLTCDMWHPRNAVYRISLSNPDDEHMANEMAAVITGAVIDDRGHEPGFDRDKAFEQALVKFRRMMCNRRMSNSSRNGSAWRGIAGRNCPRTALTHFRQRKGARR